VGEILGDQDDQEKGDARCSQQYAHPCTVKDIVRLG
jgi:hypothetical protein